MNPVAISIGAITIKWYAIIILFGIILAWILTLAETNRNGLPKFFITNLMFYCILFGIIGARVYYVIFNLDSYLSSPLEIIKIWNGGLAIHGGIIAGLLTTIIYCKKYKVKLLKVLDILAPGVILAQAIGRWGNFFNQEAYGNEVSLSFLKSLHIPNFIIKGMHIDGAYFHPTFLYESIFCIIGFLLLLGFRSSKQTKTGSTFALYLIWYGILRFFIESLRIDSLMLGNIKVAQLVSVIMIVFGLMIFGYSNIKQKKYCEDVYNEFDIRI